VVHNHPSGHTQPSRADREVTDRLKRAAIEMDLRLVDHLIVGKYGFFSFKAQGLL
jgi:DNA repair protein RadC